MISILRAADRIALPWKNGGGVTREVAIWPPDASFENFDWRVSVAEVRNAGPFSCFENIDRTLSILAGRIVLTFEDRTVQLDTSSAPYAFAGDVACSGAPVGGPVTDLNVMTRRGRSAARVALVANQTQKISAKITLLMARDETMVRLAEQKFLLNPYDALLTDEACEMELVGEVFVIAIA